MLDQLVESKNNTAENKKFRRFLATTFLLVCALSLSGVLWSLFAKDFGMGNADFELSNIVTPIPVVEEKPEPIPPKQQPEKSQPSSSEDKTTRNDNILRITENPIVPKEISVKPNTQSARPDTPFEIAPGPERNMISAGRANADAPIGTNSDFAASNAVPQPEKPEVNIPKPPPIKKSVIEEKPKTQPTISIGVINGKATSLPKPPYPAPARAVGASGAVNVQVTIDEEGSVISAKAVTGHPLLRDAAERAARNAKFSPTYLSKVPVKVNGLIVYNFTKN